MSAEDSDDENGRNYLYEALDTFYATRQPTQEDVTDDVVQERGGEYYARCRNALSKGWFDMVDSPLFREFEDAEGRGTLTRGMRTVRRRITAPRTREEMQQLGEAIPPEDEEQQQILDEAAQLLPSTPGTTTASRLQSRAPTPRPASTTTTRTSQPVGLFPFAPARTVYTGTPASRRTSAPSRTPQAATPRAPTGRRRPAEQESQSEDELEEEEEEEEETERVKQEEEDEELEDRQELDDLQTALENALNFRDAAVAEETTAAREHQAAVREQELLLASADVDEQALADAEALVAAAEQRITTASQQIEDADERVAEVDRAIYQYERRQRTRQDEDEDEEDEREGDREEYEEQQQPELPEGGFVSDESSPELDPYLLLPPGATQQERNAAILNQMATISSNLERDRAAREEAQRRAAEERANRAPPPVVEDVEEEEEREEEERPLQEPGTPYFDEDEELLQEPDDWYQAEWRDTFEDGRLAKAEERAAQIQDEFARASADNAANVLFSDRRRVAGSRAASYVRVMDDLAVLRDDLDRAKSTSAAATTALREFAATYGEGSPEQMFIDGQLSPAGYVYRVIYDKILRSRAGPRRQGAGKSRAREFRTAGWTQTFDDCYSGLEQAIAQTLDRYNVPGPAAWRNALMTDILAAVRDLPQGCGVDALPQEDIQRETEAGRAPLYRHWVDVKEAADLRDNANERDVSVRDTLARQGPATLVTTRPTTTTIGTSTTDDDDDDGDEDENISEMEAAIDEFVENEERLQGIEVERDEARRELAARQAELEEVRARLLQADAELTAARNSSTTTAALNAALTQRAEELDERENGLVEELATLQDQVANLNRDRNDLLQRQSSIERRQSELERERTILEQQRENQTRQLQERQASLERQREIGTRQLQELEANLERQRSAATRQLQERQASLERQRASIERQRGSVQRQRTSIERQRNSIESRTRTLQDRERALEIVGPVVTTAPISTTAPATTTGTRTRSTTTSSRVATLPPLPNASIPIPASPLPSTARVTPSAGEVVALEPGGGGVNPRTFSRITPYGSSLFVPQGTFYVPPRQ